MYESVSSEQKKRRKIKERNKHLTRIDWLLGRWMLDYVHIEELAVIDLWVCVLVCIHGAIVSAT